MVTRYIPVGRKFFSDSGCCDSDQEFRVFSAQLMRERKVKGQGLMGLSIESDKLTMLTQLYSILHDVDVDDDIGFRIVLFFRETCKLILIP